MTVTNQKNPDSFDYKKYSLGQLENWIHDAVNSDASPREIHDCIYEALNEEYWFHKSAASRVYTLMELLAGNKPSKNQSWTLPVECDGDDCVVTFPDELIEKTGWKEGDILEWIDNADGTYSLVSTGKQFNKDDIYEEDMLKAGYEKVDGVWTLKNET